MYIYGVHTYTYGVCTRTCTCTCILAFAAIEIIYCGHHKLSLLFEVLPTSWHKKAYNQKLGTNFCIFILTSANSRHSKLDFVQLKLFIFLFLTLRNFFLERNLKLHRIQSCTASTTSSLKWRHDFRSNLQLQERSRLKQTTDTRDIQLLATQKHNDAGWWMILLKVFWGFYSLQE